MKVTEWDVWPLNEDDELSPVRVSSNLLVNEAIDRTSYEMAMKSIEPLSELEEVVGGTMPKTRSAIRDCIKAVNSAITSEPDPILSALKLSDSQKKLVDAITACEVLKFSILNAMDAVRMNFISDFKKDLKFYTDEVVAYNVLGAAPSLRLSNPQRLPFSKVKEMGSYETIRYGRHFMIIGPESTAAGGKVVLRIPGTSLGMQLDNVVTGRIYITGRDAEGEPAPVPNGVKSNFLGITPPSRVVLDTTIKDLAGRPGKVFNIDEVIKSNFRVPAPAEGMLAGIYRTIRKKPAIRPPSISAADFAKDMEAITLDQFKTYFNAIVAKTEGATGDLVTYDAADSLFFGGLAAVSGALGLTKKPAPPAPESEGSPDADRSTSGGRSGGGGKPAAAAGRPHSFDNFIRSTSMVKGSTSAEKAANLNTLLNIIDKSSMRQELNRVVGPNVVFTESMIDRWRELAGIKEGE